MMGSDAKSPRPKVAQEIYQTLYNSGFVGTRGFANEGVILRLKKEGKMG